MSLTPLPLQITPLIFRFRVKENQPVPPHERVKYHMQVCLTPSKDSLLPHQ